MHALRVPRTVLAIAIGIALGVAGALMQGHTRNPLADPGLLGVEAGASCAVVIAIYSLGVDDLTGYAWFALAGAGIAAAAVFAIGTSRGGPDPVSLVLAGAAMSALLSRDHPGDRGPRRTDPRRLPVLGGRARCPAGRCRVFWEVLPFLAARAPARSDEHPRPQPAPARRRRGGVARAEPVAAEGARYRRRDAPHRRRDRGLWPESAFVGLVVPHLARRVGGVDYRWLVPYSALLGGLLVTGADIIGRLVVRPGRAPGRDRDGADRRPGVRGAGPADRGWYGCDGRLMATLHATPSGSEPHRGSSRSARRWSRWLASGCCSCWSRSTCRSATSRSRSATSCALSSAAATPGSGSS